MEIIKVGSNNMMTVYEKLLIEAYNRGYTVKELNLITRKGHCFDKRIAIDKKIATTIEKACILQEELNHGIYTVGDISDQTKIENVKLEQFVRAKTIECLCCPDKIIDAIKKNASTKDEIIEMLNVTEELFNYAINYYSKKSPKYSKDSITLYFDNKLVIQKTF